MEQRKYTMTGIAAMENSPNLAPFDIAPRVTWAGGVAKR